MIYRKKLYFINSIVCCLIIVIAGGTSAFGQKRRSPSGYTEAEFRVKHEKLKASKDRLNELKERGYSPKIIDEARTMLNIAEEEFGETTLVAVKPLFILAELLGNQRLYKEADEYFEKLYSITESGEEVSPIYAIGYRLRIAMAYLRWNKFRKAEFALLKAREILESESGTSKTIFSYKELKQFQEPAISKKFYNSFTNQINAELKTVYEMMEINGIIPKREVKDPPDE